MAASAELRSAEFHKLVVASQAGDSVAVAELLAALRPEMMRYCRKRLGSAHGSVDDITQEICLGVLGAVRRYSGPPDQFIMVFYRIARNKLTDWFRARGRDKTCYLADVPGVEDHYHVNGLSPEQQATNADLVSRLAPVIKSLPNRYRAVLALRYVHDLSYEQIGLTLPSTATALRIVNFNAMKALRTYIAELDFR